MPDREKVIKGLNNIGREIVNTIGHGEAVPYLRTIDDVIALLKEQENEEERILKIVWDVLHGCVSTDTVEDQDWVYEQIRNRVHPMY